MYKNTCKYIYFTLAACFIHQSIVSISVTAGFDDDKDQECHINYDGEATKQDADLISPAGFLFFHRHPMVEKYNFKT